MFSKLKKAFLAAPSNKMVPAILIASALICSAGGAALGMSPIWSAYFGFVLPVAAAWGVARKARIQRQRAQVSVATTRSAS